jgi:predicted nucleotidyltransferase
MVEIRSVLTRYGASNPRLFGLVAQGTAGPHRDIDILLDLSETGVGSRLSRLAGIRLELEAALEMPVDVTYDGLLRQSGSNSARGQVIAL